VPTRLLQAKSSKTSGRKPHRYDGYRGHERENWSSVYVEEYKGWAQ